MPCQVSRYLVRNPVVLKSISFYNIQLPSRSRIIGSWLIVNEEK
jgi:hypothetical protein